ncbi:MAG: ABC transporter permease [Acidobacteriota bacterium]
MNTPPNAMAESESRLEARAPVEISPARRLYWSVRRELWENRSLYLAPLAVAAVSLVGFFIGLIHLPERLPAALALSPIEHREAIEQPYVMVALMLMLIEMLVAVFYCLDALHGERRDRSVLFWKSLPVSDLTTVLSKASIPLLILPLLTCAVTVATQFIMLLVSRAVLASSGMSAATLWTRVPFVKISLINLFHLVAFHGLWYAPFYGWLLLVSAWSRRAPFLWATLPPVAIGVVEKIAFNTSYFAAMVQHRFMGSPEPAASAGRMTMDMLAPQPLGQFLTNPGLWLGLGVTAVFLFAAVQLRRYRGPI